MVIRYLTRCLSPGGRLGRHQVLVFHRILPEPDPMYPDSLDYEKFRVLLCQLVRVFNVIPLQKALVDIKENSLPPASLSITFDDGYLDNYQVALPLLQKLGIVGTFFIATDYLDAGITWNDLIVEAMRELPNGRVDLSFVDIGKIELGVETKRYQLAKAIISSVKYKRVQERNDLMERLADVSGLKKKRMIMNSEEVISLKKVGMEIGSHTCSHPILNLEENCRAKKEITKGKERLEGLLRSEVNIFAYPNGHFGRDFDDRHIKMVKDAGFLAAFTTDIGTSDRRTDAWLIPRFTPWTRNIMKFNTDLIRNRLGLIRGK